jgi:hypothetical protein
MYLHPLAIPCLRSPFRRMWLMYICAT